MLEVAADQVTASSLIGESGLNPEALRALAEMSDGGRQIVAKRRASLPGSENRHRKRRASGHRLDPFRASTLPAHLRQREIGHRRDSGRTPRAQLGFPLLVRTAIKLGCHCAQRRCPCPGGGPYERAIALTFDRAFRPPGIPRAEG